MISTTDRGLGWPHRQDRAALLAHLALHPGIPCHRCGHPMWPWQQLDRDHLVDRALGGSRGPAVLAHAHCNRSAGATAGNLRRASRRRAAQVSRSRDW